MRLGDFKCPSCGCPEFHKAGFNVIRRQKYRCVMCKKTTIGKTDGTPERKKITQKEALELYEKSLQYRREYDKLLRKFGNPQKQKNHSTLAPKKRLRNL